MSDTRAKVLLLDGDAEFRTTLRERLDDRGYTVVEAGTGEDAVRAVRGDRDLDVVVQDMRLPDTDGEAVLREIKQIRPEVQIVVLTGDGSVDLAMAVGGAGAFGYLEKPADLEELCRILDKAKREKRHTLARHDVPVAPKGGVWKRLLGVPNNRPIMLLIGALIVVVAALLPPAQGLVSSLDVAKTGEERAEPGRLSLTGYMDYNKMDEGESITEYYSEKGHPSAGLAGERAGRGHPLPAVEAARKAQLMIAAILLAALFWATAAAPIGITALIVCGVMYVGGVMSPDGIVQAFAKDSVLFIFGTLVMARVITQTGLDRRIGLLLLAPVNNLWRMMFVFLPLFALTCSFVSGTVLVAFMMPIFLLIHSRHSEESGDTVTNRRLLVMFALMLCFAANMGGPGSPAAGGRNAVMVGILSDYGLAPTFAEWMLYGLPFVPVATLVVAAYFFFVFRGRIGVTKLDASAIVRREAERIGPMTREERTTAGVLLGVVVLWVFASERLGVGGPPILGLIALNLLGVMKWSEVAKIHWEVVFLYAGASAIGKGLALTGGAMFLADAMVGAMPEAWLQGTGLPIIASLISGTVTNIMSDGATVAALGPITVPMAQGGSLHPWTVGFATAFASSFAHVLIIGTPGNALVYAMCKDPLTGAQLVKQKDFLKHGIAVLVLSFAALWAWTFLGYWRWIGFPEA